MHLFDFSSYCTYTPVEAENTNNETRNYQQKLSQEGSEWIKNAT